MAEMSGFDRRSRSPPRRPIIGTAGTPVRAFVIIRVAAPKGLLLIEDSGGAELPLSIPGQLVAATPTSVAVGCATSAATEVAVGDSGLPWRAPRRPSSTAGSPRQRAGSRSAPSSAPR
jgi:hypothetical protein